MGGDRHQQALALIASLAPDSRFFWTDRSGRLREQMSAADLARAVIADQVDIEKVGQERRGEAR